MKTPNRETDLIPFQHCQRTALSLVVETRYYRTVWCLILVVFQFLTSGGNGCQAQDLQAEQIHGWNFQQADDRNSDKQPDGWRRRRDRDHPAYIESEIVARDAERSQRAAEEQALLAKIHHAWRTGHWDANYVAEAIPKSLATIMDRYALNNCLEVRMDGAALEWVSPRFPMDPRFSYSLKAEVATEGLTAHEAYLELALLDSKGKLIDVYATPAAIGTSDWSGTNTDTASAPESDLAWGEIRIKVEPRAMTFSHGVVRFDSIEVYRLPRLTLESDLEQSIVEPNQPFTVTCFAMGLEGDTVTACFELLDYRSQLLTSESVALEPTPQMEEPTSKPADDGTQSEVLSTHYVSTKFESTPAFGSPSQSRNSLFDSQAKWELNLPNPGLYRVRVNLGDMQQRELLVTVMPKADEIDAGPFGWSIRELTGSCSPEQLLRNVKSFGAGWVKIPIWYDPEDKEAGERLVQLATKLKAIGVECVGRLDEPPSAQRSLFGDDQSRMYAAYIFRDPKVWEPNLEPVLTRLCLNIDWIQLGDDDDNSFLGNSSVVESIQEVRNRMQPFSQDLKLGLRWNWLDPIDSKSEDPGQVPWNALHYSVDPTLTPAEMLLLGETQRNLAWRTWADINPLHADTYSLLDRARDLTQKMIAVKRCGFQAAFISDPFHPKHGILSEDGSANELLLPWRNLASAIGSGQYVGSMNLTEGSENHVFKSKNAGLMILWNSRETQEQLYLGDGTPTAFDLWGQTVSIETVQMSDGGIEHRFPVSEWPIIVLGVDTNLVRWRQSFELLVDELASNLSAAQILPYTMENTLPQAAVGELTIFCDSLIIDGMASQSINLPSGRIQQQEIAIQLRPDASAGQHDLRIGFNIKADKNYKFSLHRNIKLGMGDVEFLWEVHRVDENEIQLRTELVNNTDSPVSFDCKLFPPGLPYQRFQILNAGSGSNTREMRFLVPDSTEGNPEKLWMRCEQIGTGRVLNYRIDL